MLRPHHRAVQPDPYIRSRFVQLAVVRSRRDHILHRRARHRSRHQLSHQQPRNRSISIGKVKNIRVRLVPNPARLKAHPQRRRIRIRNPVIVPGRQHFQRRHRLNAHRKQVMRPALKKWQHFRTHLHNLGQEIRVAGLRQLRLFLLQRHARQIVHFLRIQSLQIAPRYVTQRRLRQKLLPWDLPHARHQPVFPKCLLVIKHPGPQFVRGIQLLIVRLIKLLHFNPQLAQQPHRHIAVFRRTLDGLRPPITQQLAPTHFEFIPLRVSAKIVVVVEDQNFCPGPRQLAIEIRRREPADPASHHHQVIALTSFFWSTPVVPRISIPQPVRVGKRPIVIPAHSGQRRRIVAGHFLRRVVRLFGSQCPLRHRQRSRAHRPAIQKVPSRDLQPHPQLVIALLGHKVSRSSVWPWFVFAGTFCAAKPAHSDAPSVRNLAYTQFCHSERSGEPLAR